VSVARDGIAVGKPSACRRASTLAQPAGPAQAPWTSTIVGRADPWADAGLAAATDVIEATRRIAREAPTRARWTGCIVSSFASAEQGGRTGRAVELLRAGRRRGR